MTHTDGIDILKLRVCVGFLGESHQHSWWPSSFFSASSHAFLAPVFGKTTFSTQYYGVKAAAAIVHDERIGVGEGVSHLFRLPEMLEIELHTLLGTPDLVKDAQQTIVNKEAAEHFLESYSKNIEIIAIGPVRLGNTADLEKRAVWQTAARYYLTAFRENTQIFPYLSEEK